MKYIEDFNPKDAVYCKNKEEWDKIVDLIIDFNENCWVNRSDYHKKEFNTVYIDGTGWSFKQDFTKDNEVVYNACDFLDLKLKRKLKKQNLNHLIKLLRKYNIK